VNEYVTFPLGLQYLTWRQAQHAAFKREQTLTMTQRQKRTRATSAVAGFAGPSSLGNENAEGGVVIHSERFAKKIKLESSVML
jgi:hypothetical protein